MRKITVEHNIYKYNELEENIKNEVEEKIKDILIDDNFEFLLDILREYLQLEHNLTDSEIEYSLCYCQGDGCCFYGCDLLEYSHLKSGENLNTFEKYVIEKYSKEDIELIIQYLSECNLKLKKSGSNYSHKYTCNIDYEYYTGFYIENKTNDLVKKVNKLIDKLAEDLEKNVYYKICDEMEELGYNCYNISNEDIEDYILNYNLEFYENGKFYYN